MSKCRLAVLNLLALVVMKVGFVVELVVFLVVVELVRAILFRRP